MGHLCFICGTLVRLASHTCVSRERHLRRSRSCVVLVLAGGKKDRRPPEPDVASATACRYVCACAIRLEGVLLDEPFGYLNSVQGGSLLDLVAYNPERQSAVVGQVLADAAYVNGVFVPVLLLSRVSTIASRCWVRALMFLLIPVKVR